jgi:2-deoxy-D-gluconate 3-dehydrogenase
MSGTLFSLAGRTALVTGGATGIGQAIAHALAHAGADVAVTSHEHSADATRALVEACGRRFLDVRADLAAPDGAAHVLDTVAEALGPVDILVNNAGTIRRNPLETFGDDDWSAVMALNLDAVWRLSRAAGVAMARRGGGKIVNVASLLSFQGGIGVPSYAASKHAVLGLTKAMANELAAKNVNVNAIVPGYIATANTAALRADPVRSRQILERIPAGCWGEPDDLAGAAVFLAARASDYVHGHALAVDGGWLGR